ncbi:class I SAM-dependent methyltransferase [Candidatus Dojkabacteria bacterium]|nr:class I SAM-dependent methyltransferase [Candidatus Dojkabacteria bacterium]
MKNKNKELFYNEISDIWASKINNSETNKRLKVVFEDLLSKKELQNIKFLEVGCGLGYFSNKAFKMGAKVTGIDIGPKLVKINKKLTPKGTFVVSSASKLPFKDNTFDVVLSTEVIEHVDNQKEALKEMCRVLKKNGVLVITTPNRLFKPLFDLLSFLRIRPYHGNEKWIYSWDMKAILLKSGMKLIDEKYFNFIAPNYYLDLFENIDLLKHSMINYGFKLVKK